MKYKCITSLNFVYSAFPCLYFWVILVSSVLVGRLYILNVFMRNILIPWGLNFALISYNFLPSFHPLKVKCPWKTFITQNRFLFSHISRKTGLAWLWREAHQNITSIFLYERVLHVLHVGIFSVFTVCVCNFLTEGNWHKSCL